LILLLQDQARGLTVGLGLTAQELEELLAGCPNEPTDLEELPAQIVLGPNEFTKYLAKGELGAVIWPAVIFAEFGLCAEEDLPPLLAAGTARFLSSDNDFSFTLTRAKAAVLRANGTVTELATGEELRLLVRFQFVVGPDFDFFRAPSTEIILKD
jgi:hypothetical protein